MILNVYALLFVKHQYYTGDVGLPPAVCVLDLKKKEWVRRGKVPCIMKKINFPFFNPSYSAFICIEMPPLITHWCSLNCELCLLHSIGSTEPDHSGFPGKTEQTLVPMMHTYCSLSCSVGPLWRKWKRTVNGIYSGGVSFWSLANPTIIEGITVLTIQLIVYQAVVPWILAEVVWLS